MDFAAARETMVDCQVRPNDVTDHRIIGAMSEIERELFVPLIHQKLAYVDMPIKLVSSEVSGASRSLLAPTPFAKMLQAIQVQANDVVLLIGSGCGYGAGVLSRLANSVVAVEEDASLVERSTSVLTSLDIDNVAVIEGVLSEGCSKEGPFDVIFVEGGVETIPDSLFDQLRDGGKLVCVVGQNLTGTIRVYHKNEGDISHSDHGNVSVSLLTSFAKKAEFVF